MKKFIVAMLLCVSTVVCANDDSLDNYSVNLSSVTATETDIEIVNRDPDTKTYLYTGAVSFHITPYSETDSGHDDYNTDHNLVGVQYKTYMLTSFTNSHYRESIALSKNVYKRSFGNVDVNMHLGIVYGYAKCAGSQGSSQGDSKLCPMFVPSVSYTKYKVQPTLMLLNNAVAFTLRWEI